MISRCHSRTEFNASTDTWCDYIPVPEQGLQAADVAVMRCDHGGTVTVRYLTLDHLGSVASVSDESGAVVERDAYDAWGRRRNLDGSDNPACAITSEIAIGYTGHKQLDSTCLVNAEARIYDPTIGRFMAADSLVPDPFDGQSFNRYSYVNNSPLTFIDPSGHDDVSTSEGVHPFTCDNACQMAQDSCLYLNGCSPSDYAALNSAIAPLYQPLHPSATLATNDNAYGLAGGVGGSSGTSGAAGTGGASALGQSNTASIAAYEYDPDTGQWVLQDEGTSTSSTNGGWLAAAAFGIGHNGGPPLEDEIIGLGLRSRLLLGGATAALAVMWPMPLNEGEDAYMSSFNRVGSILKPGGQWLGQPGSNSGIRVLSGGLDAAQQLFDQLTVGGTDITPAGFPGQVMQLPNGVGYINLRTFSASGPPTIDVNVQGLSIREIKFPG